MRKMIIDEYYKENQRGISLNDARKEWSKYYDVLKTSFENYRDFVDWLMRLHEIACYMDQCVSTSGYERSVSKEECKETQALWIDRVELLRDILTVLPRDNDTSELELEGQAPSLEEALERRRKKYEEDKKEFKKIEKDAEELYKKRSEYKDVLTLKLLIETIKKWNNKKIPIYFFFSKEGDAFTVEIRFKTLLSVRRLVGARSIVEFSLFDISRADNPEEYLNKKIEKGLRELKREANAYGYTDEELGLSYLDKEAD